MNGRPPILTLEQYRRLLEARELRRQLSTKNLAREFGVSAASLHRILIDRIKRYDYELAKEQQR